MSLLGFFTSKLNVLNTDSNRVLKPIGRNYSIPNIELSNQSSLTIEESKSLLGKKIKSVYAGAFFVELKFEDGSSFVIEGYGRDRNKDMPDSLDTMYKESKIDI